MLKTKKSYVVMVKEEFYHNYEDIMEVVGTPFNEEFEFHKFDTMEEAIKFIREDIIDMMNDKFVTSYGVINLNETEIQGVDTEVRHICKMGYDSEVYDKELCYRTYSVYISERKVGLGGRPLSELIGRR